MGASSAAAASEGRFDAHSIFYDEEKASDYDEPPKEGDEYQPYLNTKVALQVLAELFVHSQPKTEQREVEVSDVDKKKDILRKRLMKIKKLEEKQRSGEVLDDAQVLKLNSRRDVESQLASLQEVEEVVYSNRRGNERS